MNVFRPSKAMCLLFCAACGASLGSARAQEAVLYAAVLETRGYVVGSANAQSGLFVHAGDTVWTHRGWRNVRSFAVAAAPGVLYVAAGNGVHRSAPDGSGWRVTTGWRITEVLDVAVDPARPDMIYAATAYGPWRSPDRGARWQPAAQGLSATFTQAVAVDRGAPGTVLLGSEDGLYRSTDGALTWTPVGPRGVPIRKVAQSAAYPSLWLAATQGHGVLISTDRGRTWDRVAGPLEGKTIWSVALDPTDVGRMAAGGHGTGVYLSRDGGATWTHHPDGLALPDVHALAFDPARPGRLWAGTAGAGVYRMDGAGATWEYAGLHGAVVYDLEITSAP